MHVFKFVAKEIVNLFLIIAYSRCDIISLTLAYTSACTTGYGDYAPAFLKVNLWCILTSRVRATIMPQLFAFLTSALIVWFLERTSTPGFQWLNCMSIHFATTAPTLLILAYPCISTGPLLVTGATLKESKLSFWFKLLNMNR